MENPYFLMKNNRRKIQTYFTGLLFFPLYFLWIKEALFQKIFLRKYLKEKLDLFKNTNDGSLAKKDFKKILSYYALGVPSVFGFSVSILRNTSLTRKERCCLSYLGGTSGLLDDFFDNPDKNASRLKNFVEHPESLLPANTSESLLRFLYINGLKYAERPSEIKRGALEVYQAQEESLQQKSSSCSKSFLKSVTWKKGGNAFLYYRACLNFPVEEEEKELFYQLGGLLQLGNDIFDVWEDTEQGLKTLANTTGSILKIKKFFEQELLKTLELTARIHTRRKNIRQFNQFILFGVCRVFVCLHQFEKLEPFTQGVFVPTQYKRSQLICDMQKVKNQLTMWRYFFKYQKLLFKHTL